MWLHTFLEASSAGLQSSDVCILFIQSSQNLKSEVLGFTKSPHSVYFILAIFMKKLGRGAKSKKIYFVAMWGHHLLV